MCIAIAKFWFPQKCGRHLVTFGLHCLNVNTTINQIIGWVWMRMRTGASVNISMQCNGFINIRNRDFSGSSKSFCCQIVEVQTIFCFHSLTLVEYCKCRMSSSFCSCNSLHHLASAMKPFFCDFCSMFIKSIYIGKNATFHFPKISKT